MFIITDKDLKSVFMNTNDVDNTVEKILFQEDVGTYSPDTGNIYYQSKITDLFKPITNDIKNFKDKIEKLFRGNLNNKSMIQVVSSTPTIYQKIGMENKPINITQSVIKKINIGKHNISQSTIENLPNLIYDPIMVLDSKTEKGSFVSILNDVDNNGERIVAIIKPLNGKFHIIPSVYGKTQLDNLIQTSNIKYIDNKKISSITDLSRLQLSRGGNQGDFITKSIIEKDSNVNNNIEDTILNQNANGFFDSELKAIVLGSNFNFGTLPHEMAHFFLDKNFNFNLGL